ncbi:MAG: P1 family peptidase [bacterium]|nr:P1 family peptidase [bacterium]
MTEISSEILQRLGVKIGHYTDTNNLTGTTVFLTEKWAVLGYDIMGSNTATFDLPAYSQKAASFWVNSVVLTGGSTFGLESIFGVMQNLEEKGIGVETRAGVIPGVVGAVIYDLAVGNDKVRPGKKDGYTAVQNASYDNVQQGNIGVGIGATTGKWFKGKKIKGGFGIGVTTLPGDIIVAAFVVTNSVGDIVNPRTGKFYFDEGHFDLEDKLITEDLTGITGTMDLNSKNTTLAVIATNVSLYQHQLMKVAELANDGMSRSIFPVHTMMDGDVVFALSSFSGESKKLDNANEITVTDMIGIAGADALGKAIKNSLLHAEAIDGFPVFRP